MMVPDMSRIQRVLAGAWMLLALACSHTESKMTAEEQSHAMSLLKNAYAAFSRNDIENAVSGLDPGIEWTEPPEFPNGRTYYGRAGVAEYLTESRENWAQGSSDPEKMVISGDRVVVLVHARFRLKNSTQWTDVKLADVYTFKNGRPVKMRAFAKPEDALRWAGVENAPS